MAIHFMSRKWPPGVPNPQNFPLRGLFVGCALSGAKQPLFTQEGARQKRRFFSKKMIKPHFLRRGAAKNADFLRKTGGEIQMKLRTPHSRTGCRPRTPRGGVWGARGGRCSRVSTSLVQLLFGGRSLNCKLEIKTLTCTTHTTPHPTDHLTGLPRIRVAHTMLTPKTKPRWIARVY